MPIQSVNRAIDILSLFTVLKPRLGITDISRHLNLSKTTVHGLIKTLTRRGFLQQDPETRKYSLGLTIYELGTRVTDTLKVNQVSYGHLIRLSEKTGHTVRLGVWHNDSVIITQNVSPNLKEQYLQPSAIRIPAHSTSLGKVILAHLPDHLFNDYLADADLVQYAPNTISSAELLRNHRKQIIEKGYSEDNEEYITGTSCIGSAIFDNSGFPVGAISISGDEKFIKNKNLSKMIEELNRTSQDISRILGYFPSELSSNNE